MLFKLASRNLLRNLRRTSLTLLVMIAGFVVMSISYGLSEGGYDRIIDIFTDINTGHVQITHNGFLDDPTIYKTVENLSEVEAQLKQINSVLSYRFSIECGGLATVGKKTTSTRIVGSFLFNREKDQFKKSNIPLLLPNAPLRKEGRNQVYIGQKIAEILDAKLDDELVLISQGMDGSISNDIFIVKGFFEKSSFTDHTIDLDLVSAQNFFAMENKAHKVIIKGEHFKKSPQLLQELNAVFQNYQNLQIIGWQEVEKDFMKGMEQDKSGNVLLFFIIGTVVALGVLNTILMSILERKKEFSILKSIGTRPSKIFLLIILESLILVMVSIVLGSLCAFASNYWLSLHGFKFEVPVNFEGIIIDEMVSSIHLKVFLIPSFIISLSGMIVSIFPAYKMSRMPPLEGMHS